MRLILSQNHLHASLLVSFILVFLEESFILVGGPKFRPRCVEGFASAKRCFAAHVPACAPDEVPLQHMLHGMFPIFLFSFLFFLFFLLFLFPISQIKINHHVMASCVSDLAEIFLLQWNNFSPMVRLDPIERLLIFVLMEQFVSFVPMLSLNPIEQILIFVPMKQFVLMEKLVQLDATNSKVCSIVTIFILFQWKTFVLIYDSTKSFSFNYIFFKIIIFVYPVLSNDSLMFPHDPIYSI